MPQLCIIADDLTGALDAAAPFAGRGLSVHVALAPSALPLALAQGAQVVAVNTASREIAESEAVAALERVKAQLPAGTRIFKKVDSRLKGHVAAELAALAPQSLFVAPAIPDFGRVVKDGHVTGFGVDTPIPVADRIGILAAIATVPDTASPAEMSAALDIADQDALLVGARGLAEALAAQMTGIATAAAPDARADKALVVVGSHDPITTAQVQTLRAAGRADWRGAPLGVLPEAAPMSALTVVQALPGDRKALGLEVATALARSIQSLAGQADLIFLTGGATAESVLAALGIAHMALDGEVLPGVPLGRAGGLRIVTKSGGFGGPDLLLDFADLLRGVQDD